MERNSGFFSKIEVPEAPGRGSEKSWAPKRVWKRSGTDFFSIFLFFWILVLVVPSWKSIKNLLKIDSEGFWFLEPILNQIVSKFCSIFLFLDPNFVDFGSKFLKKFEIFEAGLTVSFPKRCGTNFCMIFNAFLCFVRDVF